MVSKKLEKRNVVKNRYFASILLYARISVKKHPYNTVSVYTAKEF